MNKSSFEAQMAANFVASEIRRSGINQHERMKALKAVFSADDFTMAELAEVLAPDWKSQEQIEAEKAAEAAASARPNRRTQAA